MQIIYHKPNMELSIIDMKLNIKTSSEALVHLTAVKSQPKLNCVHFNDD